MQTSIEKERGLNQYKEFQLREREGLIEVNNQLQKERNDLAERLNSHRRDIDKAKADAAQAKAEAETLAKQQEA